MAPPPRLRARYRRIVWFFAGVMARFIIWELVLPRLGLRRWSDRSRRDRNRRTAVRFRALALSMGGLMIKVGQFLSARLDVLPAEITDELAGLQDEVPPAAFADIRECAERELGRPVADAFQSFDEAPLAAASLGQAHRAVLWDADAEEAGFSHAVVKVQRPHIDQIVAVDLAALRRVGGWLTRYKPVSSRADVPALVEEFAATTLEEIDYTAEARNAEHFRWVFENDDRVGVPRVAWEHSRLRVLTLEDVSAIRLGDYDSITAAGIDRAEVAEKLVATYLQQIFDDGVFHADPHPGNLFVTPVEGRPGEFRLTFIDFGMVGRVPDTLRSSLREALIAVGTQDSARLVDAFGSMGVLLPTADTKLLDLAVAQVFARFGGMAMSDLRSISPQEMRDIGLQFRELLVAMPFQLPENLLLLGRTLAVLSGMCAGLNPEFNLWTSITPYATNLVSDEAGGGGPWGAVATEGAKIARSLLALPARTDRLLTLAERGDLSLRTPMLDQRVRELDRSVQRIAMAIVFTALLVAGALLSPAEPTFAKVLMGVSVLPLIGALRRGPRRR
ncbi:ABC1 kinase family protein [Cellulomonas alba]|uniref:AarF/UbiB family protein n=1 Tax=Cellulomonas alba TaxID=3053467 RepID=A0ABT7SDG5_9CELL|nr:AarF/UbiB family protein [Cellulomonas alba]MDM7854176.1 AarF/UbiB family protein [Cellulomonas alba]